ncbi:hypothetical protein [Stappia sp.]|uniref:hypothetical protein n=1 Tax=Stappia sp. TaxID=1870903 RepID=UPI0032D8E207
MQEPEREEQRGHDPDTGLVWRFRPAGPDAGSAQERAAGPCLVVVYSQARVAPGRFGLERLFSATRHACLFLNAPDAGWYIGCEQAIDAAIDAAVQAARPARVIHYGASKGAYGALLTGLRRGDGAIYAFGPEFELGAPGTQSAQHMRGHVRGPDLAAALRRAEAGPPITLVFGLFDPVDAAGAAALMDTTLPARVRLLTLRSSHASHDHLYSQNVIRKLIARFDRNLDALCADRDLLARETRADLVRFADTGRRFAQGDLPDDLTRLMPGHPSEDPHLRANAGHALLAGEILLAAGRAQEAADRLAALQAGLDADPALRALPKRWRKQVWRARRAALAAVGDAVRLADLDRAIAERFPEDPDLRAPLPRPTVPD